MTPLFLTTPPRDFFGEIDKAPLTPLISFDFEEIEHFIKHAPKELFISHHFKKRQEKRFTSIEIIGKISWF